MSDPISNISYLTHDLRNNTGAAISQLQLLVMENPELDHDENLMAAIENLNLSIQLSTEITKMVKNINDKDEEDSSNIIIKCDEFFFENAKLAYEKLEKMYQIKINQTFIPNRDKKYISVNPSSLKSLRENIVNNAKNAGATKIDLFIEMKDYCMVATFKDNGSGMSNDDLDKLHLQQHGDGLIHGVGTKSILNTIDKHEGVYVQYASEKNKGTTIRMLVPYVEQPAILK